MPTFSRRRVLSHFAALAAVEMTQKPSLSRAMEHLDSGHAAASIPVHVSASWQGGITTISPQLLGLSYESSQLSAPDFFSSANTELIGLFKRLSPSGVLRLGGNLSEYTQWTPDNVPKPSSVRFRAVTPDPSSGKTIQPVPVCPAAIRNLRDFLDSTGWQAIYGLNLARAEPDRVVAEARFVSETLGPRLIAFQIGNEPNHYVLNRLRAPGYSFSDYFAEWSKIHSALSEAVPGARFAGPDIAEDASWVEQFAAAAPRSVVMLTGHHYAEGPPSDPSVTIEKLLAPNPDFDRHIERIQAISRNAQRPFAMTETNSCYNAGKAGLSDVFASALWAADYILQLAQAGQSGAYFHGGGAGLYSPISGGSGDPFIPRPVYYGLLFCRPFLGSEMVAVSIAASSANVSTYAFKGPRRVVAINKGPTDAVVHLRSGEKIFQLDRLLGPSPESRTEIDVTSQQVLHRPQQSVLLPKFSAAVMTLELA